MINLLPLQEKKKIYRIYLVRAFLVALAGLCFALLSGVVFMLPSFFLARTKEAQFKEQIERVEESEKFKEGESALEAMEDLTLKLAILQKDDGALVSSTVRTVLEETKSGLSLSGFFFERGVSSDGEQAKLVVEGKAVNRDALISFVDRLKKNGAFSSVDLPVSDLIKSKDLSFSLALLLSR